MVRLGTIAGLGGSLMNLKTEGAQVLYSYWDRLRDGRLMPRATEFDLLEIASILPNIMIHTHNDKNGFDFKFFGTALVRSVGADLTGLELSDVLEKIDVEKSIAEFNRVITEPIALVSRFNASASEGGDYESEHLMLPLANETGVGSEIVTHAKRIIGQYDPRTFPVGAFSGQKIIDQEWSALTR